MGSNTWNPEEWPSIVDDIRSGGASAGRRLLERERLHDNIFQTFDESYFSPVITQGTNVTYTDRIFKGYRVGNFVNIEFRAVLTSNTAVNGILITVPTSFPIAQSSSWDEVTYGGPVVGTVVFSEAATGTWYSGVARSEPAGLTVFGTVSGTSVTVGGAAPVVGLAIGDQLGYHLSYITSAIL